MMTVHQQLVLDYLVAHPGAFTSEIVAALYPREPNGDRLVSVCLAALENTGRIDANNCVVPVPVCHETEKR
jgi:hypothetical protein